MAKGMAWLAAQERRHCAVPAVYEHFARPDAPPLRLAVSVVLGRAGATGETTVEPLRIDAGDLDFLILAADLTVDRRVLEPRNDDRVLVTRNGRTEVYEVLPRGGNTPWRWSDPHRTVLRIHARLVDAEPEEMP